MSIELFIRFTGCRWGDEAAKTDARAKRIQGRWGAAGGQARSLFSVLKGSCPELSHLLGCNPIKHW